MKVLSLEARGVKAACVHSSIDKRKIAAILAGEYQVLYISQESLLNKRNVEVTNLSKDVDWCGC